MEETEETEEKLLVYELFKKHSTLPEKFFDIMWDQTCRFVELISTLKKEPRDFELLCYFLFAKINMEQREEVLREYNT